VELRAAGRLRGREIRRLDQASAAELGSDNDEIDVGSELVFDTIGKAYWADQVQRCCPMQTNPEQPVEASKMIHVGVGHKSMSNAQKLAG
jgi:hypothetical protein